jgi:Zn-dependent peptidase ImmA (M78 family)
MKMINNRICEIANRIISKHKSRDPFEIAKGMGIKIIYFDRKTKLLGMYHVIERNRFIFLNPYIDEYTKKMVMAHELGHDTLHRELAKREGFKEYEIFDVKSAAEYEANVFAAHLLLDDREIIDMARKGYDDVRIAGELGVNINMLLFKIREMNRNGAGFRLRDIPRADFFGHMDGKHYTEISKTTFV